MRLNYKDRILWWIKINVIRRYQSWIVINKLLKPSMATVKNHIDEYGTEFGHCWFWRNGDYATKAGMEYGLYFLMKYKPVEVPGYGIMKSSDGKWYGYSYRAIFGFQAGDKITKSSSAYRASTVKEIIEQYDSFNESWRKYTSDVIENKHSLEIHHRMSQCSLKDKCPNQSKETYDENHICEWIDAEPEIEIVYTGKGEHTIQNDAEAYDAAKRFSEGVS